MWGRPGTTRGIDLAQFLKQNRQRPKVSNDMVQHHKQDMMCRRLRKERHPQKRSFLEIEVPTQFFGHALVNIELAPGRRVFLLETNFPMLVYFANRCPVTVAERSAE